MSNGRNYGYTSAIVIKKHIRKKGYFRLADVKNEYSPKFLAGLMQACSEMVASGQLCRKNNRYEKVKLNEGWEL